MSIYSPATDQVVVSPLIQEEELREVWKLLERELIFAQAVHALKLAVEKAEGAGSMGKAQPSSGAGGGG